MAKKAKKIKCEICKKPFTPRGMKTHMRVHQEILAKVKPHFGGPQPKYETPEQLQDAINDYFENGVKTKEVVVGRGQNKEIVSIAIPTITGLCRHLGYESRQSFYDLEKVEKFAYTVKRARLFIEQEYEEQLQVGNTTGAIFALKNFGWKDNADINLGGQKDNPLPPMIIRMPGDDE